MKVDMTGTPLYKKRHRKYGSYGKTYTSTQFRCKNVISPLRNVIKRFMFGNKKTGIKVALS